MLTLLALTALSADPVALIGDDLSGWTGSLDDWTVEDGTLIGRTDGSLKANRFIWADIEPVRDFDLTVEVWVSAGGNSGLQYRSAKAPKFGPFALTGYQCDVVSTRDDYNGMLYEEKGRRILAHTGEVVVIDTDGHPWVTATMPVPTFAPEQWHTYRVRVVGNHHRHWIDGRPTIDAIDLDRNGRRLKGLLGVQTHVGPPMEIRYRSMRLTRLPYTAAMTADIPDDAERVVPQGQDRKRPKR